MNEQRSSAALSETPAPANEAPAPASVNETAPAGTAALSAPLSETSAPSGPARGPLLRAFLRSVLPALLSSVVLGTFSIVDGLFIGNKVFDDGLSAINFAYPLTAFIQAVGFGIGMGGSVCISLARGRGDGAAAARFLFNTYLALLAVSLVLFPSLYFTSPHILRAFGARGVVLAYAQEYTDVILYGTLFQVLGQGLVPIVRNFGHNAYTMGSMCAGFGVNIFLDWLFIYVFDMKLAGAAWGTFAAQAVTAAMCAAVLCRRAYRPAFRAGARELGALLRVGLSPFGIFFSPNIVLILINKAAELNGGTVAVAAYTAVSYVTFVAMRLIQGVGDGAQPLLSYFEGRGDMCTKHAVLAYGLVSMAVITLPVTLLCIFLRAPLSGLFGLSQEGRELFSQALLVMILPLAAFGLMRIAMSYFYAQDKNLFSNILVYGEPVIVAAVVFTLPSACGLFGIWLSAPISQVFLALLALAFLASMLRRERARRLPPA